MSVEDVGDKNATGYRRCRGVSSLGYEEYGVVFPSAESVGKANSVWANSVGVTQEVSMTQSQRMFATREI